MQITKILSAFVLLTLLSAPFATAAPDKNGVLHEERSLYTRILVHQNKDLRCLKFTLVRSDSNQSCLDLSQPKRMVFTYAKMTMTALLFNPGSQAHTHRWSWWRHSAHGSGRTHT